MERSKIISKKILHQSKFFRVLEILLERDGKRMTKDFIERDPYVIILPITENNELYLVKQFRDALREETIEVVAGTMNKDEDPLEAAKRELSEETGLIAGQWTEISHMNTSANMMQDFRVYVARDLKEGASHQDDDEEIETLLLPINSVYEKILNGEIRISNNVSALLLYKELAERGKIK